MYALLTGTVPPAAHERVAGKELPAPRALNPAIPEALDAVILQALDLNLNRRPQTIAALSRVFTPGTLDAPLPDAGLGSRTVRIGAERPLRAPARIPIRTGRVTEAPAPPPPPPVQPDPSPQEMGPAGRILDEGLSKQTTPIPVAPLPAPLPSTLPATRPVAPEPVGKVAPPLDPVGTKKAPNQKRPPVALAPSPSRSPSTQPPKKQAAREPLTKGRPPLDLIDKVHDR